MPLELSVVQEPLSASFVGALEQLVAVNGIVLLEGGAVIEYLAAGFQRAAEDPWLLLARLAVWSPSNVASGSLC